MKFNKKNIEFAGGNTLWSKLFFTWLSPWMSKFLGPGVNTDDLPRLPANDDIPIWTNYLEKAVNQEERISKLKGKSLRIYKPLIKVFWLQCLMVLLLKVFFDVLQTLATLSLRSFVSSLEPDSSNKNNFDNNKNNYYMGSVFIILTLLKILVETQYSYWCGRVSLRIQASLISMTFRRVVHWKTSAISFEESAIGKSARKSIILRHAESRGIQDSEAVISSNVFNLIVVDTLAVEGFLINAIECFIFPFRLIIAYFVLKDSLGSSTTIVGIFTLIVFLVISFTCQIIASTYKAPFMSARDKRIDRCHEVLSEVRTLQMMGYQNIATDRVMKCRQVEMKANKIRNTLSLIGNWIGYQMSGIAQLVLFLLAVYKGIQYSREHNVPLVIPASVGVTTLKVLFSLLGPCRNLSMYSFATIEALISFNRFQSFLRSRPLDLRHCDSHSITSNNFHDLSPNIKTPTPIEHACMHNSGANSLDDTRNIANSRLITDDRENTSSPDSTRLFSLRYQTLSSISDKEAPEDSIIGHFDHHTNSNIYSRYTTSNKGNHLANLKGVTSRDVVVMRNSSYTWNKETRKRNKYNNDTANEHTHLLNRNYEFSTTSASNNSDTRFKLKNINLSLSLGETIIVVGSPGSGKTSLMNAVLDEIVQESGLTYVQPRETKSPIAYASQIPWIPNGSIKNIILFGRPLNQLKYDVILDCCQLNQDFKSWQDGDLRIVDEGGCSLSGGQRARICLARALYSLPDYLFYNQESSPLSEPIIVSESSSYNNSNLSISSLPSSQDSILYLLDDIFVSLDPGVSKTIFKKLFGKNGLLRKVATILSIDHTILSFLMSTSKLLKDFNPKILVLDDGSPQFFGTYQSYLSDWRCINLDITNKDNVPHSEEFSNDDDFSYNNNNKYDTTTNNNTMYLSMNPSTKCETLRKVMEKEGRVTGMVSKKTYYWYFSKLKWSWTIALLILCYSKTMFDKGTDYYMGSYTSRAPLTDVDKSIFEGKKFALIYIILALIQLAVSSMVFIGEAICGIKAAIEIHDNLLVDVLNAPLNFFDSNPVGRVLSRFSTDLLMVDNIPIMKIATVLVGAMNVLFQCIVVVSAEPSVVFLFPMIGLGIYYAVARYFSRSSRELQRMCLVLYSPLCGVFSEAMSGGPIIRAFRAQDHYMLQGTEIIDMVQRAKFMQLCSKEWSSLRTQLLTFPLTAMSSNFFTALISDFFYSPSDTLLENQTSNMNTRLGSGPGAGIVGIALYYSESIASNIGMTITSYVNMEKEMISVERLHQYYEILNKEKIYNLPFSSPCKVEDIEKQEKNIENIRSGVKIIDLEVRYRRPNSNPADNPDEIYFPPAINKMNACTGPNEHIGVIGRTGSGKSTFLQAILGLVPITSGRVFLDNIPIDQMSNEDRNKLIGILPQVPLILKGWTVRNFLDPYQKFSKDDIWDALNLCGLSSLIRSLPGGKMLDAVIVPDNSSGSTYNSNNNNNNISENSSKTEQKSKMTDCINSSHSETPDDERYLSDSQLRYLSLARLVLNAKNYRLILVDEPPPDVFQEDTIDYVPIHQLLRQYFPHCTVFVVAHHAASLQNCKKVWVLGKGRILFETDLNSNFSQDQMLQLFQTAETECVEFEASKNTEQK
ncbi:unnamed protein product [Cryptosporidium hominis]|uniref:ABC transporter n=1 Tax=Cryptosporidium hominis TaxID=237895 RepID=A0A0S4TC60_CRYHO|nr:hypothetical protein [Cryptosporidium hominis TU502]PPS93591.1 ABC transporter [Cryptosporidium hominis]CUV04394.1 unnamed protein product [Cryptosporidium hominis]|eukprot:PPS93591.1 ABC transporter [Cryptosporidium hominis]